MKCAKVSLCDQQLKVALHTDVVVTITVSVLGDAA